MRIALIQQHLAESREASLERGLARLDRAAHLGANLACFAELAFEPFHPRLPRTGERPPAETIPGPTTDRLAAKARELGLAVVANLYERDGDRHYDSSPVIDADGSLLGVTRMLHITEYDGFHEQQYYDPGDRGPQVYETRAGRVGVAICYDRHYPEVLRALGLAGAQVVVVPQAGTIGEWPDGMYEAELRVGAFQNGYFAAVCNRVGVEDALHWSGGSFVTDPEGRILARAATDRDEVLVADLDLKLVEQSTARRLFLKHRRTDWMKAPVV